MTSRLQKPGRHPARRVSLQALASKALKDPDSLTPDEIRRLEAAALAKLKREKK